MMNFGEWLRKEITATGNTMAWASKNIKLDQSVLTKWRQGVNPNTENFLRVCVFLSRTKKQPLIKVIISASKTIGIEINEGNTGSHQEYEKIER
jgi:hypothetical protein